MKAAFERIEWMSVLSFILVIAALLSVFVDWVTPAEGTALMGAALVAAILSLRGR